VFLRFWHRLGTGINAKNSFRKSQKNLPSALDFQDSRLTRRRHFLTPQAAVDRMDSGRSRSNGAGNGSCRYRMRARFGPGSSDCRCAIGFRDGRIVGAELRRIARRSVAIEEIARRLGAGVRSVHRWISEIRCVPSTSKPLHGVLRGLGRVPVDAADGRDRLSRAQRGTCQRCARCEKWEPALLNRPSPIAAYIQRRIREITSVDAPRGP
jgi:hypothetical protein